MSIYLLSKLVVEEIHCDIHGPANLENNEWLLCWIFSPPQLQRLDPPCCHVWGTHDSSLGTAPQLPPSPDRFMVSLAGWVGQLAHDLLFQGALIQSSWLNIIWICPGRQYQLRGLNLHIRKPHTNGRKENVWNPGDGTKLTCPKILASSSPRSGIKVGWDGWIITYNVEIINCKSILHWTYPGEDLRQGRHLQSHVGSPACAWPHKSLRHVYCTRLTHSSKPCGPIFFSPGSHQAPVGLKLGPVWVCHSERF